MRGSYKNFGSIKFDKVVFLLNGKKVRGVSLFMANFIPLVKIIPYNKGECSYDINSIQYLTII